MTPRHTIVPQPRTFSPQLVAPSTLPPRHVRPNRPRYPNSANPPSADGQRPRLRDFKLSQMRDLASLVRVPMGERGRSGAGDGRWRREEITPLKEGGGDKLLGWTVGGVRIGESSCLPVGGCVMSRCVCASMSRFAGVGIASPTALASSSSSPSSEEWNSGSRSEESGWLSAMSLPLALTIESESMSQDWTTFMNKHVQDDLDNVSVA
jgi:hypothetical protein